METLSISVSEMRGNFSTRLDAQNAEANRRLESHQQAVEVLRTQQGERIGKLEDTIQQLRSEFNGQIKELWDHLSKVRDEAASDRRRIEERITEHELSTATKGNGHNGNGNGGIRTVMGHPAVKYGAPAGGLLALAEFVRWLLTNVTVNH